MKKYEDLKSLYSSSRARDHSADRSQRKSEKQRELSNSQLSKSALQNRILKRYQKEINYLAKRKRECDQKSSSLSKNRKTFKIKANLNNSCIGNIGPIDYGIKLNSSILQNPVQMSQINPSYISLATKLKKPTGRNSSKKFTTNVQNSNYRQISFERKRNCGRESSKKKRKKNQAKSILSTSAFVYEDQMNISRDYPLLNSSIR